MTSIIVEPAQATVEYGERAVFTATPKDMAGNEVPVGVLWSLSDPDFGELLTNQVRARQIGSAEVIARRGPVEGRAQVMSVPVRFASVSLGSRATCATTVTGRGYCWGEREYVGRVVPGAGFENLPAEVEGGLAFVEVSAGLRHACGVTESGAAYCWGENRRGALGTADSLNHTSPRLVSGGLRFSTISAGWDRTCGIAVGGTYCWGDNSSGALGIGLAGDRNEPTRVVAPHAFTQVSTGQSHTCGVTVQNEAYCWGDGFAGRLGTGGNADQNMPSLVIGGHAWHEVHAGLQVSCGRTTSHRVYCWGSDNEGQLGDGATTHVGQRSNVPVAVSGPHQVQSLAVSRGACLIDFAGEGFCWGQLPGMLSAESDAPTPVIGAPSLVSISVSDRAACAMSAQNILHCWDVGSPTPVPVPGQAP